MNWFRISSINSISAGKRMRQSREFVLVVQDPQWSRNSNFWSLNFQDHDVTSRIHAIHGLGSKRRFLVSICSMFVKCLGCISTSSTLSTIRLEMILSRIVVQINETFFLPEIPCSVNSLLALKYGRVRNRALIKLLNLLGYGYFFFNHFVSCSVDVFYMIIS